MRAWLRGAVYFLGGFAPVATLLYTLVARDAEGAFDATLRSAPACNVLFVGPSYVRDGVFPHVFDREAKKLGSHLRACKYALSSLKGYEVRHDLDVLLREPWPRLELVVIDITLGSGVSFEQDNWFKARVVEWHTLGSLPWLYGYYREQGLRGLALARTLAPHYAHLALNYLGVGRGVSLLERANLLDHRRSNARHVRRDYEVRTLSVRATRRVRGPDYPGQVQALLDAKLAAQANHDESSDAWARELEHVVRDHGYEVAFLIAPVLTLKQPPQATRAGARPLSILDFDDPHAYPELYESDRRGYTSHLNERGADDYSRLLAREIVQRKLAR
jgi:hypothetical protein